MSEDEKRDDFEAINLWLREVCSGIVLEYENAPPTASLAALVACDRAAFLGEAICRGAGLVDMARIEAIVASAPTDAHRVHFWLTVACNIYPGLHTPTRALVNLPITHERTLPGCALILGRVCEALEHTVTHHKWPVEEAANWLLEIETHFPGGNDVIEQWIRRRDEGTHPPEGTGLPS